MTSRWMMVAAAAAGLMLAGCRVEQVEETRPPDVQVEPGQLPEYQPETGGVDTLRDTLQVAPPQQPAQQQPQR